MVDFAKNVPVRSNVTSGMDQILDMPRCRVTNSGNQTLTTGVITTITFDTNIYDTDGMHSTTTNTSRITFRTAGCYLATFSVLFAVNATFNYRKAFIRLNGTTFIGRVQHMVVTGGVDATSLQVASVYQFNAGDYVEAQAAQDSGGALNITPNVADSNIFTATMLSTT